MKKLKNLAIALIAIIVLSCERDTPDHTILRLSPEGFADFYDANLTLAGLLEFENPGDGFLGFIHKADRHQGNFYLINLAGETYELTQYNEDGSFAQRIGGIGRGPSEYISASDFAIEHPTGNIFVINHSNEVLNYSKSGEFLGEVQTGIMSSSLELAKEGLFFRYHGRADDYRNQVISVSDGQGAIKTILHETHYDSGHIAEINFIRDGDQVYFREVFDNRIFRVNEESAVPVIEFDFGDHNYNPEFASMDILSIYEEMVVRGSFLAFPAALIANEWIYAFFSNEKDQIGYHILYNASKREYQGFKTTKNTGLVNAHLLDEAGNLGFFVTGISLMGLFDDTQIQAAGFRRQDITEDSTWLVWVGQ